MTITGQSTHFVQGTTTASFGAGVTVAAVTVNSPTNATVVLNIDPAAAIGTRDVTVTTEGELVSLPNGFTVTPGTPVITLVNPNSGQQGQTNESVNLTGQFTHWVQGTTTASFGAGITVNSVTVAGTTSLTANLSMATGAAVGPRTVTVTTGTEVASLPGGFVVSAATNRPPIVSAGANQTITLPSSATLNGTVSDDGLPFGSLLSTSWSVLSAPLTAGQIWLKSNPSGTLPSPVQGTFSVLFDPTTNSLIVFGGTTNNPSNDVWVLSGANGLSNNSSWTQLKPTGTAPAPRYSQGAFYDPGSNRLVVFGGVGPTYPQTNNDVWILTNANGTGGTPAWLQPTPVGALPVPRFNVGLTYDPVTNRMIVFGGSIWATSGTYYYQTNETWILTNANGTGSTAPTWISAAPGGSLPIGRSNPSVAYDPGSNRLISFGGYIPYTPDGTLVAKTLNDTWVLTNANGLGGPAAWIQLTYDGASTSPTQRWANLVAYNAINNTLTIGLGWGNCLVSPWSCSNFSDVWSMKNANGLSGTPTWTQLAPTGGPPTPVNGSGYDSANDRLIGFSGPFNDTWILTNATNATLGVAGTVTFSSPTFSTPNIAGQFFPVVTDATFGIPGSYTLRLTANDSQLSSTSDVTVTVQAPIGTPLLTAAVPYAGQQGQAGLAVTITGQNTGFVQGTTQVSFGVGITVTSVAVTDPAHVTAMLSISAGAALGFRDVTVTTGTQVVTLADGFTVTPGTPVITLVNPNSGQQGQTNLAVTITGQYTHFSSASVVTFSGGGITAGAPTAATATNLTVPVSIAANAPLGAQGIQLVTGAETVSLANALSLIHI